MKSSFARGDLISGDRSSATEYRQRRRQRQLINCQTDSTPVGISRGRLIIRRLLEWINARPGNISHVYLIHRQIEAAHADGELYRGTVATSFLNAGLFRKRICGAILQKIPPLNREREERWFALNVESNYVIFVWTKEVTVPRNSNSNFLQFSNSKIEK